MNLNNRQRVLLYLLYGEDSGIEISSLMHRLYIARRLINSCIKYYHFVPYKYRIFSFEAFRDVQYNLVSYIEISDNTLRIVPELKEKVQTEILKLSAAQLNDLSEIKYISIQHPDYQNSAIIEESILKYTASGSDIREYAPAFHSDNIIYSIGYEMKSVDFFYCQLLNNGVKGILDVRRNAYSFKYGFLSQTLRMITKELNLTYSHIPELGVDKSLRRDLTLPGAYDHLFEMYELDLKNKGHSIQTASEIVSSTPTALLCFEADKEFCHRSILSVHLAKETNMSIIHI